MRIFTTSTDLARRLSDCLGLDLTVAQLSDLVCDASVSELFEYGRSVDDAAFDLICRRVWGLATENAEYPF
jgi:hypothetical protein